MQLGDAVLNLAEMAGSDLPQPPTFAGGWTGQDALLIEPIQLSVEMFISFNSE